MRLTPLIAIFTAVFLAACAVSPTDRTAESASSSSVSSAGFSSEVSSSQESSAVSSFDSSLTQVDARWNLYTNRTLGFSMKVPKKIWNWNKVADVVVLEDPSDDTIFIAPSVFGPIGNEEKTTIEGNALRTSMWDEILPYKGLRVQITDDPLEEAVSGHVGDCLIDRKVPAGLSAYRLILKDAEEGSCWDATQAWYQESTKRLLFFWESVPFESAAKGGTQYDESMFESLRFLE